MNGMFRPSGRHSPLAGSIVTLALLAACSSDAALQNFAGPDASVRWRHHQQQTSASASQSLVSVSAPTVSSGAAVTLTLRAKDSSGANLATGGLSVAFTQGGGTSTGIMGATSDSGN